MKTVKNIQFTKSQENPYQQNKRGKYKILLIYWLSQCTCQDGSIYWVGDQWNYCDSLQCIGGTSGICTKEMNEKWAFRKVVCAVGKW